MKVQAEIKGDTLTENIKFHGDTQLDNETISNIKELSMVLEDVFWGLDNIRMQVRDKQENSAKEILRQLKVLRKDILWIMFEPEDVETLKDIIYKFEE